MKRRKIWLTAEQTEKILEKAKSQSVTDWLILILCRHGWRVGEIVGRGRLPGVQIDDLRDNGLWMKGKGYAKPDDPASLYILPKWICVELHKYAAKLVKSRDKRLFPIHWKQVLRHLKQYAELAGVADCKEKGFGPHRLRAYFATDLNNRGIPAFTIRDLMRHKNIATTNKYVGVTSPERNREIMESLASSGVP